MKKIITILMAIVIVIGTSNTVEAYTGIQPWFIEEIEEADGSWRIIPSSFDQMNLSENMTRAEFCEVLIRGYLKLYPEIPRGVEENVFSDSNEYYINTAYYLGITSGYTDGTFRPNSTITRQEIFQMLYKMLELYKGEYNFDSEQKSRIFGTFSDAEMISDWAKEATIVVRYEGIVKGDNEKRINPLNKTTRAEGIIMVKRMLDSTVVKKVIIGEEVNTPTPEIDNDEVNGLSTNKLNDVDPNYDISSPLNQLGYNSAKHEYVYDSGDRYVSGDQAKQHMVTITIDVWHLDSNDNKYSATKTLTVNESIADRVILVFNEIYAGSEQFPIHNIHAYAWRSSSTSEHNQGLAIDINPNQNYMIRNGGIIAGLYWKPNEDPFSIPENGDVVNAFKKYGFSWGGNAWHSANDYMHFSYFGR